MVSYVRIVNTTAQDDIVLLETLEQLWKNGPAGPEELVDRARPADSQIHYLFEWDDTVAGERYRLEQARLYIARVEYVPALEREPLLVEMPTVRSRAAKLDAACLTGVDLTMCSVDRLYTELQDIRTRYSGCPDLQDILDGPLEDTMKELTLLAMSLPIPEEEAPI